MFKESSRIDSTWAGNLVDMVRARRVLEIIEEDSLLNNATVVGSYLLNRIRELQAKYPDEVSNVRGRGLMCAFDLKDGDRVHKVRLLLVTPTYSGLTRFSFSRLREPKTF